MSSNLGKETITSALLEMSDYTWFTEGTEDGFMEQCKMDSYFSDDFTRQLLASESGEDVGGSYVTESLSSYPTFNPCRNTSTSSISRHSLKVETSCFERKTKKHKTSCTTEEHMLTPENSLSPNMVSIGSPNSPKYYQQFYGGAVDALKPCQANKRSSRPHPKPPASSPQDHVIAERMRREKLSQRFIALATIVPGLKKTDKSSVLGDCINYLKQLQERVKTLEEKPSTKAFVKKFQISAGRDDSSSMETDYFINGGSEEQLLEIEARVSDRNILIRIHCENRKGLLLKTLMEIEKLNLSVVNLNSVPFGTSTLDITVNAEMDEEFSITMKDLIKCLQLAFLQFL